MDLLMIQKIKAHCLSTVEVVSWLAQLLLEQAHSFFFFFGTHGSCSRLNLEVYRKLPIYRNTFNLIANTANDFIREKVEDFRYVNHQSLSLLNMYFNLLKRKPNRINWIEDNLFLYFCLPKNCHLYGQECVEIRSLLSYCM